MHTYILRRLLLMIPTLLGITLVVFTIMAAAPGGIGQTLVGAQNLDPEAKRALEEYYNRIYGLDDPAPVQYLRWLNNVSPIGFELDSEGNISSFSLWKGSDFGKSFLYSRPALDLIAERVPITLLLNVLSIPLIYLVAITIGVRAATQRGSSFDVGSGISLLGLWSVPTMLAGVLMIGFFANDDAWRWFPASGLSAREAQDMPFLPHFGGVGDIGVLFLLTVLGTGLAVWVAGWEQRLWRVAITALAGAMLGALMANALPGETHWFTWLFLMVLVAALATGIAWTEYRALRVVTLGIVGLGLGMATGAQLMDGPFVRGFLLDRLWHLALPVLVLSYGGFAFLAKLTRTAVLENLLADFARTARAKGVPEHDVLWKHVFRNSLLPLITISATLLPALLAGSVIVESIFSIEGMGKLAIEAVKGRDRELVLSITLISGILTLVGYLIADILYAIADPRVSYD
ncbi:MAG TPA: ABC transporter permease [Gammaproteobacteria bacterium]|nr:ABC transporter permease [Gammaproteobacteria bacterium]